MKNTLIRSLAAAALATGAVLALPSIAYAAADGSADDTTTHASASVPGGGSPALGFWIGGGALVLASGAIAVGATVRRHRHDLEA